MARVIEMIAPSGRSASVLVKSNTDARVVRGSERNRQRSGSAVVNLTDTAIGHVCQDKEVYSPDTACEVCGVVATELYNKGQVVC